MTLKTCSKCHKLKILSEFTLDNKVKSKLVAYCKACAKENRIKNKDKIKEGEKR
jgi:RNase P subunit RPR2